MGLPPSLAQGKTEEGRLHVSSSNKNGEIGPVVMVNEADLQNLARALVWLLRYLEGTAVMDTFREKQLCYMLDELAPFHKLPLMGQLPPGFLTVRLYVSNVDPIEFNISRVKRDVAETWKGQNVIFDVHIVAVACDSSGSMAYVIPWDELQDSEPRFCKTRAKLTTYAVPMPTDIDLLAIAGEMGLE